MQGPTAALCAALSAVALCLGLAGCAANPGPPPLVDPAEAPVPADGTGGAGDTSAEDGAGSDGAADNDGGAAADANSAGADGEGSGDDAGGDAAGVDKQRQRPAQAPERTQITVGTDQLRNGLNPHLQSDESAVVRSIANLVLPSAFIHGQRNDELLVAATRLPTSRYAMTVRYVIAPEAQWSDGTPITGADFAYLWRGMTTTAGTVDGTGYDAVVDVRVSGAGGKVVDVDFAQPVGQWQSLFSHLLPSHLLAPDATDFRAALHDMIPASAGRYMVREVDRGRGTVTLHRNDRFWGDAPASIDIVTLQSVRTTTQVADQLRVGQLAFVDKTPEETSSRVFALLPETRLITGPRTLGVHVSATSGLTRAMREELRMLIDVPLLATIATGRSTDLNLAPSTQALDGDPEVLPQYVARHRSLRIGADASDPVASAAARSLADMLNRRGVRAHVVTTDTNSLLQRSLPEGNIDVLVGWRFDAGTSTQLAGRMACPPEEWRDENLSGLCTQENQILAGQILSGEVPLDAAKKRVAEVEHREALWVPVVHETRILALGTGIVGPAPDLQRWTQGLSSAARWRLSGRGAAADVGGADGDGGAATGAGSDAGTGAGGNPAD